MNSDFYQYVFYGAGEYPFFPVIFLPQHVIEKSLLVMPPNSKKNRMCSGLEQHLFVAFGKKYSVNSFLQIQDYLKPMVTRYYLAGVPVQIESKSIYKNISQLQLKLNLLPMEDWKIFSTFAEVTFNRLAELWYQAIAENLAIGSGSLSRDFWDLIPFEKIEQTENFKKVMFALYESIIHSSWWEGFSFHHDFSSSTDHYKTEKESVKTLKFLALLSGKFLLQGNLWNSLENLWKRMGGKIEESQFADSSKEINEGNVVLESYLGRIYFNKLVDFINGPKEEKQISFSDHLSRISFKIISKKVRSFDEVVFFQELTLKRSVIPFLSLIFRGDSIEVSYFVKADNLMTQNVVIEDFQNIIFPFLQNYFDGIEREIKDIQLSGNFKYSPNSPAKFSMRSEVHRKISSYHYQESQKNTAGLGGVGHMVNLERFYRDEFDCL
jgi:hypothetical protein